MKPVYLEFCGINSFSEKAQINFSALLSGGVFGIFGDTGSGKSTILDAIHFALYGEIDRVPKAFNDCINYRSESASVTFDFEIVSEGERRTYRVKRERKRKSGSTKASLYEYTDAGKLLALAEGARDVDERLNRIVGLTFEDFKTCIALPQGDFAALVKATPADRVKLVARLFNLDKYGEKLSRAVNEKCVRAEEEVNLIKARMGENEGGRDEVITELQTTLEAEKQALITARKEFESAENKFRSAVALDENKRAYEALKTKLSALENRLEDMRKKQTLLERSPKAKAVAEKHSALANALKEEAASLQYVQAMRIENENAKNSLELAQRELESGNFDEEILRLTLDLEKVNALQADVQIANTAKKELDECIERFNALKKQCPWEDFEEKRAALEKQLSELGEDDTLLGYLKRNFKDVLLLEAYGEFRADLRGLLEKYPQTRSDVEWLLQKYAAANAGSQSKSDIISVELAFKELERKKKTLKGELDALNARFLAYKENEGKKNVLVEQGKALRQNYLSAMEKIQLVKDVGGVNELSAALEKTKLSKRNAQEKMENARKRATNAYAQMQTSEALCDQWQKTRLELETAFEESLRENGFSTKEEATGLLVELGDEDKTRAECAAYFDEYAVTLEKYRETDAKAFENFDVGGLALARSEKTEKQRILDECNKRIGAGERELDRLKALREKYKEQAKELTEKEEYQKLCEKLRQLVRSNRFLEFIACEYLQEICASASKTLLSLTGGRYFLKYEKEFKVGDNLDGGNFRAVKTLSGGETFLVSLSLALSLSAAICLKSLRPIEFFFLDEGFGTLDGKLVDTVMDVLGKLGKSFAVGLISHVEELKHRIDNKILVTSANEGHGSQIRVETF